jgi:voltage-dependent potassium channel beta subunit
MNMEYRRLGRSGLKVSALSLGSWVTYGNQVDEKAAIEMMAAARDQGVNFFDNAEVYASGRSETLMGVALNKLGWDRLTYIVSTKFFWGLPAKYGEGVNEKNTLNRKYLMQAIDQSLKRFNLDYVDLVYCHRADPHTPIEETVYAMHDMIVSGKALYWGTSEWSAAEISEAWHIADKHHLHKPVMEQPEYNLFKRRRVEQEYARLYEDIGLGLTTWSPLASGLLSGKYIAGVPDGSRASLKNMAWMKDGVENKQKATAVAALTSIAAELGCTAAQLSIAWCLKNPNVSTVITGASRLPQFAENIKALDAATKLDASVMQKIESVFAAQVY